MLAIAVVATVAFRLAARIWPGGRAHRSARVRRFLLFTGAGRWSADWELGWARAASLEQIGRAVWSLRVMAGVALIIVLAAGVPVHHPEHPNWPSGNPVVARCS